MCLFVCRLFHSIKTVGALSETVSGRASRKEFITLQNMKTPITKELLVNSGFPAKLAGPALYLVYEHMTGMPPNEIVSLFKKLNEDPASFADDDVLGPLAIQLAAHHEENRNFTTIRDVAPEYAVYGAQHIEEGAHNQMEVAMRLPITAAGALMPDAHQGYGLPIGGVLATRNAIIPYGVGVDIGCRMALSIYDIPEADFALHKAKYQRELIAQTRFGAGNGFQGAEKAAHDVLDHQAFNLTPMLRQLKDKAWAQLGTSGGGNHFVEFGIIAFAEDDAVLGVPKGRYVALLTHSGSRGFGATIAGHYTKVAKEHTKLPQEAVNLAWLDLDSQEGQEYWIAMNLAGDYASACHEVIHRKMAKAIGANVIAKVENHHNFAWKEIWNGEEVIVHRKGATPAGKGVMGIIPGSMTAPGFLVRGKGVDASLQSASHGAGRQMSRTYAIKNISKQQMRDVLKEHDVTLIGAGKDEAPMAYKDIHAVMEAQRDLVDVVATFHPKIVRMADDGSRED